MKFPILFLWFSGYAFANSFPLPGDATGLTLLRQVEVLEIKSGQREVCLDSCQMEEKKKIKLRFTLAGCVDELGPVSHRVKFLPQRNRG